jgi:hypothetical protein
MPFSTFDIDEDDGPIIVGAVWLGRAVKERRRVLGISQRQLEAVTGIDQTLISRLETGRLKGIKHSRLLLLIGMLGGLDPNAPPPSMVDVRPRRRIDLGGLIDLDDDDDDDGDEPAW